ncbi:MAG: histidine phosphatase family protein [bacterium]|nr:histidine phosphatase family protein [Gammaproteobacteria bacterium]HIL98698.1 histidine phosphatase family protein [Pseudomonadales bacterium]
MTTFLLIRHGEIDANIDKRWHGATDSELNTRGMEQAGKMGRCLSKQYPNITKVYSSPLKRTMKTAMALADALGTTPEGHEGLREYGIGELEDTSYDSLLKDHDFFDSIARNQDFAPPGGESVNRVRDRMISAFDDIRHRHVGEKVALVSHGAAMAIALSELLKGSPFPFFDFHMSNTGVSQLVWGDSVALTSFNDTDHL